MPMEYSDDVVEAAITRVRGGETVKAVSRDIRVPPKRIREWLAWDDMVILVRKRIESLTPEQRATLEANLRAEMARELEMLQEERLQLLAEQQVLLNKQRNREAT